MTPLHWPAGYKSPAPCVPSSWLERLFPPFKNYTQVKRALDEQLQARHHPEPGVWGEDLLRIEIAQVVCQRLKEEYEWPNDHFLPEDPFDIVCLIPWDDLEIVEVIMDLERDLGIKIKNEEIEACAGKTSGYVVETLFRKCKARSECIDFGDSASAW